ncbi:hypothetical protein [Bdellovibrio bacteriovorus]|uniref:hypothetical protein n=1 Tax=Bdellovibrio bacteriovorus TaxID=959 RepID=UPI0035A86F1D
MNSLKSLFILAGSIVVLLLGIAAFNYQIDPQCYYGCKEIDPNRATLNTYYQVAQRILAFPKTEVVILGSSRGENTPPLWIEEKTGLKTLNLSASGAELGTKLAFLTIAKENTQLKKVIWLADYFELISENADAKIKNTPALRKYLEGVVVDGEFRQKLHDIQGLIDHNTLEASIYFLNNKDKTKLTQGAGSDIDYRFCESSEFKGKETTESLKKEVDLLYQSYTSAVIKPLQNKKAWNNFANELASVAQKGVDVYVVITPYHPEFLRRLKAEHKDIYENHLKWIENIQGLASQGIKVLNYFDGISHTDESPTYWNDGVHFTCRSSMLMLEDLVKSWNQRSETK